RPRAVRSYQPEAQASDGPATCRRAEGVTRRRARTGGITRLRVGLVRVEIHSLARRAGKDRPPQKDRVVFGEECRRRDRGPTRLFPAWSLRALPPRRAHVLSFRLPFALGLCPCLCDLRGLCGASLVFSSL